VLEAKQNLGGRVQKTSNNEGCFQCSKCKEWKTPQSFSKNKQQKTGLNYACKPCMKIYTRKYNLPTKYGITILDFEKKLQDQNGKCSCCKLQFNMDGKASERPCVDHNHSTQEVRDLLCGRCNLAAGNVLDSSLRAEQLAKYLKNWNC
jgi:hypothetical protein